MANKRWLVAMLTIATPFAVQAESWIVFFKADTGSVFSFDRDSTKPEGTASVIVWVQGDHSKNKNERARSSKIRLSVDCVNETTTMLYVVEYAPNGGVMRSFSVSSYDRQPDPIIPGSMGASLLGTLCAQLDS